MNQVWLKRRVTDGVPYEPRRAVYGVAPAPTDLHPIRTLSAASCTPQMGVAGPWHERLPHFRVEFTPSAGEELQSEYFVPRTHAVAAIRALYALRNRITPLLQMSEIRTIAADDLWMSPCYRRDCVALHFTWRKEWDGVRELLPHIEAALAPFDPAPHWGKLFTLPPEAVRARYPRLPEFRALAHAYDPAGKFRNAFHDTYLGDAAN